MNKYAQLKRFHHNRRLQVYIYDFMYVDLEPMPVEENFPDTKEFVENYNKMLNSGPFPKQWLGFSYICSENY